MSVSGFKAGVIGLSATALIGSGAFLSVGFLGNTEAVTSCTTTQSPSQSTTIVNPQDVSLAKGGIPIVPNTVTGETIPMTGETLQDAELIAGIGFALEKQPATASQPTLTDSDIAATEMASMGEARLLNLPNGDRDSAGLFQQRPSIIGANGLPYWGTAEQVRNPIYSINRFYQELLMRKAQALLAGQGTPAPAVLVQSVQASGNPAGYAPWWPQAVAIVTALKPIKTGTAAVVQVDNPIVSAEAAQANTCPGQTGQQIPDVSSQPTNKQGWHVPLSGNFVITQGYTWAPNPSSPSGYSGHPGVDLSDANLYGRPILAAADGVTAAHNPDPTGFGNYVELDHAGNIQTIYGHMAQIAPGIDQFGVPVKAGQVIGYADSTGDSTGNHLHFEVHVNGAIVNPIEFMLQRGINLADYATTPVAA